MLDSLRTKDLIYRYSLRMTSDSWEAEDLTQDVLLKVHCALKADPLRSISKAYLFRMVSNAWKDKCKRMNGQRVTTGYSVPDQAGHDEELATRELLEVLAHRLSPRSLVILLLRDVFDFTARETANFLSSTEEAVQVALSRARLRLRKIALQSTLEESSHRMNNQYEKWGPHDFDRLVDAFRRRDPKAICRAYVKLATQQIRISRLLWVNGKLAFYMTDPDGNTLMVTG
ncbi:sigma-70 family RNA polymerase sigma factor [Paenibacillus xylaniclasticus]|uniref:sigma-70 family RNA polymerase sigma factor n=1 Tax=Paenibacillus xylaniclasticus TaxID=588083 RepID=UPI000FD8EB3E|nr:sigma-70 family RNA polymerase sigma factor [Paenibacillus xylaniclasticus]